MNEWKIPKLYDHYGLHEYFFSQLLFFFKYAKYNYYSTRAKKPWPGKEWEIVKVVLRYMGQKEKKKICFSYNSNIK